MKEASGELNMTLITIVAIAAIAGLFAILWPSIRNSISNKWSDTSDSMENVNNNGITGKELGGNGTVGGD